ncbi:MAG: hypothetical protein PHQ94_00850 [Syntrophomonas sp.]|jgi:hypothetical protein|nr:hypothetical protein [Syntrophomonas sp.]
MDKATVLKYFIIGVLSYYLVKGILVLALWQALVKMEERGKERIARRKKAIEEMRQKRTDSES